MINDLTIKITMLTVINILSYNKLISIFILKKDSKERNMNV